MATRALIGYLDTDGDTRLTTTYNHYDGYPDNLGKGLETFYNSDAKAEEIANVGYISFLDSSTGEWEAKNKDKAGVIQLPDNFNEAMMEIAAEIDSVGGDYGYIWDNENEEWITVKNNGIRSMAENLEMELAHLKDKFAMFPEQPEQVAEAKDVKGHVMMLLDKVESTLKSGEKDMFATYQESVMRDVKEGGSRLNQYEEFTAEDMVEDYKNYIADKMDIDEAFVRQMKYKAGIIK
jgi:hypothetical protein